MICKPRLWSLGVLGALLAAPAGGFGPFPAQAATLRQQHIVTTLYLWFPAPHTDAPNLNSPESWVYDPPFDDGSEDLSYWVRNLQDLASAGLTGAFLVAESPKSPEAVQRNVRRYRLIVRALRRLQRHGQVFKVGLLVAIGSQPYAAAYEGMIRPFYQTVPPKFWLGHRVTGPEEAARRPMIYFWDTSPDLAQFNAAVTAVPKRFREEFGARPFLAFERETYLALQRPALAQAIIQWNAPIGGHVQTGDAYRVSSLGVGNNEQLIRPWRCHGNNPADPVRNYQPRGTRDDPAAFLRREFLEIPATTDLLFIQDANELNEGTTFLRAKNFPAGDNTVFDYCAPGYRVGDSMDAMRAAYAAADNGRYLPEDYYLAALRELIRARWPQNLPGLAASQAAPPGAQE